MNGAILSLDKYGQWFENIKKNKENLMYVNYWTKNWIPDKVRLREGDLIYFRMHGFDVAEGKYYTSKKCAIEKAFIEFGLSNGLKNSSASLNEFIYLINQSVNEVNIDTKIGCILVRDIIIYNDPKKTLLPNKTGARIVYL
ncbi:hypothetical protein ACFSTH_05420 [Paenibacillus yanchengensis]|uniref:Uncharacterized protein n=1 Tax=Paenibacillus yanchengensis TaxID=2035833 RepID=A0ABW4YHM1_9BACL